MSAATIATPTGHPPSAKERHAGVLDLDLSNEAVANHWGAHGVASLINAMERCEPWAVDVCDEYKGKAEIVVADMTRQLNATTQGGISQSVDADPDVVIDFLGYLRSGRALVLFAWLTQVHPSIPTRLVNEARFGGDEFGSILIERITTLEKQHLLSRVFSPERIALVLELLAEVGLESNT